MVLTTPQFLERATKEKTRCITSKKVNAQKKRTGLLQPRERYLKTATPCSTFGCIISNRMSKTFKRKTFYTKNILTFTSTCLVEGEKSFNIDNTFVGFLSNKKLTKVRK